MNNGLATYCPPEFANANTSIVHRIALDAVAANIAADNGDTAAARATAEHAADDTATADRRAAAYRRRIAADTAADESWSTMWLASDGSASLLGVGSFRDCVTAADSFAAQLPYRIGRFVAVPSASAAAFLTVSA